MGTADFFCTKQRGGKVHTQARFARGVASLRDGKNNSPLRWRQKGTREAKSESGCRGIGGQGGTMMGFCSPYLGIKWSACPRGTILIPAPIVVHVQKSCCTIARKGGFFYQRGPAKKRDRVPPFISMHGRKDERRRITSFFPLLFSETARACGQVCVVPVASMDFFVQYIREGILMKDGGASDGRSCRKSSPVGQIMSSDPFCGGSRRALPTFTLHCGKTYCDI